MSLHEQTDHVIKYSGLFAMYEQEKGEKSKARIENLEELVTATRQFEKPEEAEDMTLLTADVAAVIRAEGESSAVVVGHDWGGGIAWSFAAAYPQMTERLIIMNLPQCLFLEII